MTTTKSLPIVLAPSVLVWAVRLLAVLGAAALISTGECEMVFISLFVCFFLLGIKMGDTPRVGRVLGFVQPALALLALSIAVIDFFYLSKSFLLAVAHFLLMLEALQLLLLRTNRENLGGLLISSLMILSASTLAVEWTYFAFLCLYLPVLIWTLMLHTLVVENADVTGSFVPRTFLWGRVMPKLRKAAGLALLSALLCCAVVFVFFPRFNFQGFRGQFLQPVKKTGFTNQVDLGGARRIAEDNSIAMRVEINRDDLKNWPGYIRGGTLEVFDGKTWKRAPYSPERVFQIAHGKIRLPGANESGPRLRQKIYLESMDASLLFAVSRPVFLTIDRPMIDTFADGSIQRIPGDAWRIHYEVESVIQPKRGMPPSIYATPFPKGMSRVKDLSDVLMVDSNTSLEKIATLNAYFQSGFSYSLQSNIPLSDPSPVETFLFETKTGHCEYFASALVLMLRSQGIPARIATGFYSSEWNDQGGYMIVRMRHAHAWVEAYAEGAGWLTLDPTPADYRADPRSPGAWKRWEQTWDYINLRWNRYILSYDFERQKSMFESITQGTKSFGRFRPNVFSLFPKNLRLSLSERGLRQGTVAFSLAFLGLILVLLAIFLIRFLRASSTPKTVWFYKPFLAFLQKKGGKKAEGQTLAEYINSIHPKLQNSRENVAFLEEKYHQIRFRQKSLFSDEDQAKIRFVLKQLK